MDVQGAEDLSDVSVDVGDWPEVILLIHLCFLSSDSPPTRTPQTSVFFGSQDLSRDCSFLKPLASTPGNKTLPIGNLEGSCGGFISRLDPFISPLHEALLYSFTQ